MYRSYCLISHAYCTWCIGRKAVAYRQEEQETGLRYVIVHTFEGTKRRSQHSSSSNNHHHQHDGHSPRRGIHSSCTNLATRRQSQAYSPQNALHTRWQHAWVLLGRSRDKQSKSNTEHRIRGCNKKCAVQWRAREETKNRKTKETEKKKRNGKAKRQITAIEEDRRALAHRNQITHTGE